MDLFLAQLSIQHSGDHRTFSISDRLNWPFAAPGPEDSRKRLKQFFHAERLGDIVVHAGFKTFALVSLGGARA